MKKLLGSVLSIGGLLVVVASIYSAIDATMSSNSVEKRHRQYVGALIGVGFGAILS